MHLQDCLLLSLRWNVTDWEIKSNCRAAASSSEANRRWQVLLGSALASAALASAVQARCSTVLRNRLPCALPVHQGMFTVLPLAWMLGHEEPHVHDPPALAAGSFLTTEGIRNDSD